MSGLLNERFPDLSLPRLALGRWPTPVAPLEGLAPGGVALWCKREDLSGAAYGGNKVRKLEWILPAVPAGEAVLSLGAAGSNHLVATGIYCRQAGLELESVLAPQPDTPHVRDNLLRTQALSRRCWPARSEAAVSAAIARAMLGAQREGRGLHPVWIGGSTPRGCVGWVEGGLEIAAQVAPTDVFVACGSSGTAAGLLLGFAAAGLDCRVHAVRVAMRAFANRRMILGLAHRTRRLLRAHGARLPAADARRLVLHHELFPPGYGRSNPPAEAAVAEGAVRGLYLEPTYSGKALAACLAAVRTGGTGGRVLFINSVSSTAPPAVGELDPALAVLLQ